MTKDWEKHKEDIRVLYQQYKLEDVRRIMMDEHNFRASVRAYRGRLVRWGFRKYNRRARQDSMSSDDGGDSSDSGSNAGDDPMDPPPDDVLSHNQGYSQEGGTFLPERTDFQGGWTHNDATPASDGSYLGSSSQYGQAQRRLSSSQNYDGQGRAILTSPSSTPSTSLSFQQDPYWYWSNPASDNVGTAPTTTNATAAPSYPPYMDFSQQNHLNNNWSQSGSGGHGNNAVGGAYGFQNAHGQHQYVGSSPQAPYMTNPQGTTVSTPSAGGQGSGHTGHGHGHGSTTGHNTAGYGAHQQDPSKKRRRR